MKKPKRPHGRISMYGGMHRPRWGKNINKKAKRLAGEVRTGRIEDLPEDHPARQA